MGCITDSLGAYRENFITVYTQVLGLSLRHTQATLVGSQVWFRRNSLVGEMVLQGAHTEVES